VNSPGRNLISPVGKRKASANVSDNHTELSTIAVNINGLVSLLFPLRPNVNGGCRLCGKVVDNALHIRVVFESPTLRMMGDSSDITGALTSTIIDVGLSPRLR